MSDTTHQPVTTSAPPSHGAGLTGKAGTVIAATGEAITEAVRYGIVIAQLTAAGLKLALLSDRVTSTYEYVEKCAHSVDQLADQAEALAVDRDTVGEHRDAATLMRSVLAEAEAMAADLADLSTSFQAAADAHEADYGSVAEAANAMPVEMADRSFYSNR
ncbi:hypothetical protein PUR71_33225 [Streptomyces sp. SP17BM10]|uniref:hypothetical protein n=1 Tax=Streptomyces sp. SP17BM10 TaxID=3002530 RepID=UPI002E77E75F|nr:hypothetical protein [Streptomyces sp. SP17BM10]MEE1787734.1 hypothetical protein [Streptomyces sp. SP17BM10]